VSPRLFNNVVELVSHYTQVEEDELFTKSRKKALVDARYVIIFICRQLGIKQVYIQRFFKLKGFDVHYTTLFHAYHRIEDDVDDDELLEDMINIIISKIRQSEPKISQL
tara:strand:+ start:6212 stop:6538 length:327 start_codon:yes stop_codon:yes gene_type:complete